MIPLPAVTDVTAPFWESCRHGVLRIQRCRHCGHHTVPPDVACNRCLSPDIEWVACAGTGTLESFSVVHRASQPAFEVPYVVAIVRLDEGWSLFSGLIHCDPAGLRIGMRVTADFVRMSDEITLPYFTPIATSEA